MSGANSGERDFPRAGLVEWFAKGDSERVERVIDGARHLNIRDLRLRISWADWHTSEGDGWYGWLLSRLGSEFQVVPCFLATPPALGVAPKTSSPPASPKDYANFIDAVISRLGENFEWLELWSNPTNPNSWDGRMDPDWSIFSEMIRLAAAASRKRGKRVLLAGNWPTNLKWFEVMTANGVLAQIDAIGIHGFPSSTEVDWRGWASEIEELRRHLSQIHSKAEIWISEAGYSTWQSDEQSQLVAFAEAMNSGAERVYWRELLDRGSSREERDERDSHYGLLQSGASPKKLYRVWKEGGLRAVTADNRFTARRQSRRRRPALITGGAGFIGTNLADRLLNDGLEVTIYDNLARPGVERNAQWLQDKYGDQVRLEVGDIRDARRLREVVRGADQVFHFAAQVAVTTSLLDPREDFEINIGGTVNVLEAIREMETPPPLIFTSTNKVYGGLADLGLEKNFTRYQPAARDERSGISEARPLDFHSPYGCSKGAADQYVLDYARTFNIPAVVFRMSCIYGPHQMGTEDQGWIAHFLIQAIKGEPITIYGDGMQVRDVLFVGDLVDAFVLAQANCRTLSGQAFNIGGGPGNTLSLNELLDLIGKLQGCRPEVVLQDWRAGDQRYYVSDFSKFKAATGWQTRVAVREGVQRLHEWLEETRETAPAIRDLGGERALLTR